MTNIKPINKKMQKEIYAGSIQLPMSPLYLTKTACEIEAGALLFGGYVSDMSILQLAQEIFAHACCYYGASVVKGLGVDSDTVDELYNRGNPIDIEDGGDTLARQAVYLLIWELTPTIIAPFSIKEEVVKK